MSLILNLNWAIFTDYCLVIAFNAETVKDGQNRGTFTVKMAGFASPSAINASTRKCTSAYPPHWLNNVIVGASIDKQRKEALSEWIDLHYNQLRTVAFNYCNKRRVYTKEDKEDIFSDSLIKFYRFYDSLDFVDRKMFAYFKLVVRSVIHGTKKVEWTNIEDLENQCLYAFDEFSDLKIQIMQAINHLPKPVQEKFKEYFETGQIPKSTTFFYIRMRVAKEIYGN